MFFFFVRPDSFGGFLTERFPNRYRVEEFVEVVRETDPTISVATLAAFVRVANRLPDLNSGELALSDIASQMGVPYSSLTRQVDLLAAGAPPAIRGLNLLEKRLHPTNRRQREFGLTDKGQQLLEKLSGIFASASEDRTGETE